MLLFKVPGKNMKIAVLLNCNLMVKILKRKIGQTKEEKKML
jgi:hypothetical protein